MSDLNSSYFAGPLEGLCKKTYLLFCFHSLGSKNKGCRIWNCVIEITEKRFGKDGRLNTFPLLVLVNSVLDSAYICNVSNPLTCKTETLDSVRQESFNEVVTGITIIKNKHFGGK